LFVKFDFEQELESFFRPSSCYSIVLGYIPDAEDYAPVKFLPHLLGLKVVKESTSSTI
jgi:hypothetical protein